MAAERFESIRAVVTPLLQQLDSPDNRATMKAHTRIALTRLACP
jgi:hypothetical protein